MRDGAHHTLDRRGLEDATGTTLNSPELEEASTLAN